MKKIDAAYYFFMSTIFLLAAFGFDFFDIGKQTVAIFITEFAAIMITYGHIFSIKWNKDAPSFFKERNSSLKIIGSYIFFFIWAGIILVRNNYFFTLFSFIFSTSNKGLKISHLNPNSSEISNISVLSLFQLLAMFLTMITGLVLSANFADAKWVNYYWGILYYSICGILVFFYSYKIKHQNNLSPNQ